MSDGNFNRSLLPKNELAAGLRAGKAQMRAKAEKAFEEIVSEFLPEATDDLKKEMAQHFMDKLRK